MEFDCVFGDLALTVTLKADDKDYFGKLSQTELLILMQWIYLSCNLFMTTEQLRLLDKLQKEPNRGGRPNLG